LQATDSSNRLSDLHGRLRVPSERSSKGPRAPIRSKGTDRGSATIKTEPTHPKFALLAFLADLSNADKHRELSTVAATVSVPGYGYDGPESDMRFTDSGEGRDLHDGTKVMAFTVTGPKADQVEVGPFFSYEVRVEGHPFRGSLERIAFAVWKSVRECESGLPFPVMTPPLFVLLPDRTVFADPLFPVSP
jgi:hypothetical protein